MASNIKPNLGPDTIAYTMPLGDGRTAFVRVPSHMAVIDRSGELAFKPEGIEFLDKIRALAIDTPASPSPGYLRTVRKALRLTQPGFARMTGRSTITIKRWENGSLKPSPEAVRKLRQIVDRQTRRGIVLPG